MFHDSCIHAIPVTSDWWDFMLILLFHVLFTLQCIKLAWEYSSGFQHSAFYPGEMEKLIISDLNKLYCFWNSKLQSENIQCELTEIGLLFIETELVSQSQSHNVVSPTTKQMLLYQVLSLPGLWLLMESGHLSVLITVYKCWKSTGLLLKMCFITQLTSLLKMYIMFPVRGQVCTEWKCLHWNLLYTEMACIFPECYS